MRLLFKVKLKKKKKLNLNCINPKATKEKQNWSLCNYFDYVLEVDWACCVCMAAAVITYRHAPGNLLNSALGLSQWKWAITTYQAILTPSQSHPYPPCPGEPRHHWAGCQPLWYPVDQNLFHFFQIRFYMRVNPFYPEVELNFISVFWPNLPNGLQAAYEVSERDEVRFFKGNTSNYCSVSAN